MGIYSRFAVLTVGAAAWAIGRFRKPKLQDKGVEGFHYFPNRKALNNAFGLLGDRFKHTQKVDALFVLGIDFYHSQQNNHAVQRLILPDPESASFAFYIGTVSQSLTGELIREVTALAKKNHARVRWSHEFLSHAMVLADTDRETGWVHIESVLPYLNRERRPSYTIEKKYWEESVLVAQQVFDQLWDASIPQ